MREKCKRRQDELLEILFPRKCPVCDDIILPKDKRICPDCIDRVHFVKEPTCLRCGKEILDENVEYCIDCSKKDFNFDWGVPLMNYDSVGRKIISDFKYYNRRDNADFIAEELTVRRGLDISNMCADFLVPVPMYFWKKRIRGFNQAEVLAKRISTITGIPVAADMIIRNRNTRAQKNLENKQRSKNLEKAFSAGHIPEGCKGVILVDDIYTTGSTVDACAKVLKANGVERVYFLCACIGRNY